MAAPAPQTDTTAPRYIPFVTDLLRLLRAPFAPRGVFEEQREKPTFWLPWVVASVFFLALAFFAQPITRQMIQIQAAASGRPVTPSAEQVGMIIALVSAPVALLIGALIAAVVLYLVVMVTGAQARFKGLMTVSIFPVLITFLQQLISLLVLRSRGVETIQSTQDLQVSFGLDLITSPDFAQAHKALAAFLRGIGPFEIWALVITAIGLITLERVPKQKAWIACAIAFVVGLVIRSGLSFLQRG